MTSLTLLLLVDAFRPDYLRDAPYLADLASRSATGRLREPFGFLPRAAYFGGLSPDQLGFTNMLYCDPASSPFAVARWLPPVAFTTSKTSAQARRYIDEQARARVPAYAASYVSSMNIPGELLPHFAVAELEAPWSPKAGYRSIFHELDERGESWTAAAWPLTNNLADHSDAGIVEHLRTQLKPEQRFAYLHLQELDAAGHWFGPEGSRLRHLVRETDALVAGFVEWLRTRYDELKIIVFGDHGMVSVTRAIDVRPALAATGLIPGVDYVYFLDSTMVRVWFLTSRSRELLVDALTRVPGLGMVSYEDKVLNRIEGCHPSNAHEIFLADPGVVISPDFFSNGGGHALGMHGYDPDCRDNQGLFLAHAPEILPGDAGIVDSTEIYQWTRELLGFALPRSYRSRPTDPSKSRRFTQSLLPSADASVATQLTQVLESLKPLTDGAEAIVLTGSFGRGEGGIVGAAASTTLTAVNDFDILVVGGPDISRELADRSSDVAARAGLDFLDLVWTDGTWADMPATMLNLDLRYGSQVLSGAPDVLTRLPVIPAADITMQDGLILLLNRIGGLLSGLTGELLLATKPGERARRYLCNQAVKALVAVGDVHLIEWHAYDASYRVRRERFASLAPGAGIDTDVRYVVDSGYRLKVLPDYDELPDPVMTTRAAAPLVLDTLRRVAEATLGSRFDTLSEVVAGLRNVSGAWVAADNARLLARSEIASLARVKGDAQPSIRQTIYAAMPLLLAAGAKRGFKPSQPAHDVIAVLGREVGSDWETVRGAVVSAWLAMVH